MGGRRSLICAQIVILPGGKTATGPYHILVRDGRIDLVQSCNGECKTEASEHECVSQPEEPVAVYTCHLLTPGFVDIHNHGLGGAKDVTEFWMNPVTDNDIRNIVRPEYTKQALPKCGTTSFLATIVFPVHPLHDKITAVLTNLEKYSGKTDGHGAILEGIHSEGPIISDLGGLPGSYNDMSSDEFTQLLDKLPSLKIMTISPHADAQKNYSRIKQLLQRGVVPALGHDRQASEHEILAALSLSATQQFHITHLFNVCTFHHRNPGLVNFGLLNELPKGIPLYRNVVPPTVEVIGDLRHVNPLAISLLLKARHFSQIAFVTDCVSEATPGRKVKYNNREMEVSPDGVTLSMVGTNTLAGSCSNLLDAFHTLVKMFDVPLGQAVAMLSENPARIAKLSHIGSIEVSKRADLLMFDEDYRLIRTVVNGRIEYDYTKH